MTCTDSFPHQPRLRARLSRALSRLLDTPFDRRARTLARRVEALRGLSDAELNRMGLSREDILGYVFGRPRSRR